MVNIFKIPICLGWITIFHPGFPMVSHCIAAVFRFPSSSLQLPRAIRVSHAARGEDGVERRDAGSEAGAEWERWGL